MQYSLFENFATSKMTCFVTIVLVVLVSCRGCGHACALLNIKSNTQVDNAGQLESGKVETGSITSRSLTVDRSPLAVDSICVDATLRKVRRVHMCEIMENYVCVSVALVSLSLTFIGKIL